MLEVRVSIRIGVPLLEGHVAVELGKVLAKRIELIVKILGQLLASNVLRAAINDQPA